MYFVAEATTMSAPYSIGLTNPVPTVLSTIRGISASWAIFAITSKSGTSSLGFPIVSVYIALVLLVIAFLNSLGFLESTNSVFHHHSTKF